jgi:virginiamycin B lyase
MLSSSPLYFLLITSSSWSSFPQANAQPITLKDLVTYSRPSNFIKEFKIPLQERGLKGITTDLLGNAWFYHSTYNSSTIVKLDPTSMRFTQYKVEGKTVVDKFITDLAGGQLAFDNKRNVIWFTDARTNSIGKLNTKEGGEIAGKIELVNIPTPKAGPMGIALSPDGKSVWFAEITGNKIANLDIESNRILEYPVIGSGSSSSNIRDSGPTFLTFDNKGLLWVTLSYSYSVLRVEPWLLIPNSSSMGMSTFAIPKPDVFSPFGIAIVDENGSSVSGNADNGNRIHKMFLSDHGSSRVISTDINSNLLQNYSSYWTSPSQVYPTTLPGQLVVDKSGKDIYFPQHGGNRITKIDTRSGLMTEYDIPTGPLSTVLFISVSDDGNKVWFTEWASNKIGYLDTTIPIPLHMQVIQNNNNNNYTNTSSSSSNNNNILVLKKNQYKTVDVLLNAEKVNNSSSSLSLNEVEVSLTGMSDSGIKGITYTAKPERVNMSSFSTIKSNIDLNVEGNNNNAATKPGQYTAMVRTTAAEREGGQLLVSLLYPVVIKLDIPVPASTTSSLQQQNQPNTTGAGGGFIQDPLFPNIIRLLALPAAIGLVAYIIYRRIRRRSKNKLPQ